MKNTIPLFLSLFLCLNIAVAQKPAERFKERIDAQRAAFITERAGLTAEEAQKFWPIYNEMTEKLRTIRESVKFPARPADMTDAEAEKLIFEQFDREARELAIKKEYYPRLKQAIAPTKIVKVYKAERDFKAELLKRLEKRREQRRD